ncbi:hypothetical protein EM308_03945 [Flavobacterium gilvum]|uniref:Uncharacterized protein n=1 Tax=Flavobacterium gilvum TaxID=1492737 RepID=A0AAC9I6D3_9FLAO|nr:hypothetical protein EM308_03945 [Flavobacterium gilvum]
MNNQIYQRLADLHNVLVYCSDQQLVGKTPCFTTAERILINQERGSWLSQLSEDHTTEKRYYQCHDKLESKIKFILKKVIDNHLITK